MDIIQTVKTAWGWTGIDPVEVVTENDFANYILKDEDDKFWRICPEDVYCKVIAESIEDYNRLITDDEFVDDWFMDAIVAEAKESLGELADGQKYALVIPGVLDGDYGGDNLKIAPIDEIISFAGDLGKQIKDLPDGSKIELKVSQ